MVNKTQEALKMAIEQIKWADHLHDWHDGLYEALKACEEALAELALEQMAQNAREIVLVYCKHGRDGFCKECAMEEAK